MRGIKKFFLFIIFTCALGVFVFSVWKIIDIYTEYNKGSSEYEVVRDEVRETPEVDNASEEAYWDEVEGPVPNADNEIPTRLAIFHTYLDYLLVKQYEFNFDKLLTINQDIKGWIIIPDTHIDYPVVQAADNDYYLRRTVEGTANNAGSIFLDYRVKTPFITGNSIIYGHNQRNSQMFHDLMNYSDYRYYQEHDLINLYTPDGNHLYQIYSAYVAGSQSNTYAIYQPGSPLYEDYLLYTKNASLYDTGISVGADDIILTLSTCTNEHDEERFVVHAKYIGTALK